MERIVITKPFNGICAMQICADKDATDEEILEVCNRENPAGTSLGWCEVARENYKEERARPVQCSDNANRLHLLVIC